MAKYIYTCNDCAIEDEDRDVMRRHFAEVHVLWSPFCCRLCSHVVFLESEEEVTNHFYVIHPSQEILIHYSTPEENFTKNEELEDLLLYNCILETLSPNGEEAKVISEDGDEGLLVIEAVQSSQSDQKWPVQESDQPRTFSTQVPSEKAPTPCHPATPTSSCTTVTVSDVFAADKEGDNSSEVIRGQSSDDDTDTSAENENFRLSSSLSFKSVDKKRAVRKKRAQVKLGTSLWSASRSMVPFEQSFPEGDENSAVPSSDFNESQEICAFCKKMTEALPSKQKSFCKFGRFGTADEQREHVVAHLNMAPFKGNFTKMEMAWEACFPDKKPEAEDNLFSNLEKQYDLPSLEQNNHGFISQENPRTMMGSSMQSRTDETEGLNLTDDGPLLVNEGDRFKKMEETIDDVIKKSVLRKDDDEDIRNLSSSTSSCHSLNQSVDSGEVKRGVRKQNCPVCRGLEEYNSRGVRDRQKTIEWVACDGCDQWYHLPCTGLVNAPEEDEEWHCRACEMYLY